jgi:hypothetical protein
MLIDLAKGKIDAYNFTLRAEETLDADKNNPNNLALRSYLKISSDAK